MLVICVVQVNCMERIIRISSLKGVSILALLISSPLNFNRDKSAYLSKHDGFAANKQESQLKHRIQKFAVTLLPKEANA